MKLNLYNTNHQLILVYATFGMALAMFILGVTFMSIPKDLDEAA